jgi:hypothetical protein
MGIPKPRREGQSGGMNHRSSYGGFRNSGGNVKPPSKLCALFLFVVLALPVLVTLALTVVL